jgi:hypothetical protein
MTAKYIPVINADLKYHIGELSECGFYFNCYCDLGRQFKHTLRLETSCEDEKNRSINKSLRGLLSPEALSYWKGPVNAMARKYRDDMNWKDQLDPEYRGLKEDDTEIPLDLDTTSLAPILAFMEWKTKPENEDEQYAI